MNRRSWITLAAIAAVALAAPLSAGAQSASLFDPSKLTTPPLHPIPAVHPERYTLPNGAVIYLLEDHELPTVRGTAFFPASPTWVNADRAGLADLVGEAMRSGGSAKHGGDWLDDRLAAIGAEINTELGNDMASGSFHCLSDNTSEVVKLMAELLRDPAFPADKIELAKVDLRRQIASRNDEMLPLLVRTARVAVNGKDSPYSRQPEYATVEPIERADCAALHGQVFVPNRMILAVFGDFQSAEMKALIASAFGDWAKSDSPAPPAPAEPPATTRHVMFAPKEDVTQSGIVLTHRGFLNKDPDAAAMDVVEMALGGGFQSRLVNRIRTQRGLAYATGAFAGGDYVRPAAFIAYSLTKSESTMVSLDLLRGEVVRVTQAPFTDAELATAKQSVENSLVFRFERPEQVLFRAAYYELVGYPSDFLQSYQTALHAVTASSAFEAAKRKIHPDQLVTVIVGKESDFDRKLDSLGQAGRARRPDHSAAAVQHQGRRRVACGPGARPRVARQGGAAGRRQRGVGQGQDREHGSQERHHHGRGDGASRVHGQVGAPGPLADDAQAAVRRSSAGLRRQDRMDGRHGPDSGSAETGRRSREAIRALAVSSVLGSRSRHVAGAG